MRKIKTVATRVEAVPVTPPPAKIVLEMSETVARTLYTVTQRIGGPYTGKRLHMDEIQTALSAVGISEPDDDDEDGTGSIYFK